MAIVRNFCFDTQTVDGAGGIIYDLITVSNTEISLNTGNLNNTTYTEMLAWQLTTSELIVGTSFSTSINIVTLTGTVGVRWRLQRVDSSNNVLNSSDYSTVHSTTGIKNHTFTFSPAWVIGDRIRLSLEIARTGGHGNVSADIGVRGINSYVDTEYFDIPPKTKRIIIID